MRKIIGELVRQIVEKDKFQDKYLKALDLNEEEQTEFENVLYFLIREFHYTIDYIADSYSSLNQMIQEETYFFIRNDRYRNSSFQAVNEMIYANAALMERYMVGLVVSDYLWMNHLAIVRYFKSLLPNFAGEKYLEIGPGFGQFLTAVIKRNQFAEYRACDVSEKSVEGSNLFLRYCGLEKYCCVEKVNFFDFPENERFDMILAGEVLEHVEDPLEMLKKIRRLLPGGAVHLLLQSLTHRQLIIFHCGEQKKRCWR